jgi:hypothetical protein
MAVMKLFYLIKTFVPFIFLPIAPGVVQVELERLGLLTCGSSALITILIQIAFTLGMTLLLVSRHNRKHETKAFLRMSCVSKKVFHQGRWISVEQYLADSHNVVVSHGLTPDEANVWVRESEDWLREEKAVEIFEKAEVGGF